MTAPALPTLTPASVIGALSQAGDSDVDALRAAIAILTEEGLVASDVTPSFFYVA